MTKVNDEVTKSMRSGGEISYVIISCALHIDRGGEIGKCTYCM